LFMVASGLFMLSPPVDGISGVKGSPSEDDAFHPLTPEIPSTTRSVLNDPEATMNDVPGARRCPGRLSPPLSLSLSPSLSPSLNPDAAAAAATVAETSGTESGSGSGSGSNKDAG